MFRESANGDIKSDDLERLLGRKEIHWDDSQIAQSLQNKVILITGAGGTIGSEITRQLSCYRPKKVILLGHGENSIYTIFQEVSQSVASQFIEYVPVIADIQNIERIRQIFHEYRPDIIFHAAAHKHVPLMEANPDEAYLNNVKGTYNVAQVAGECGVSKFILISTDKAVKPNNVMGATKRIAELIVTQMDKMSQTMYSVVRFGNVLGSRGSVIPAFARMIAAGGPVQVTDFRMTRYFMSTQEAGRLVLYSSAYAEGGEIIILDMGDPIKILDLARQMIELAGYTDQDIPIVESGIRPGDKLSEEVMLPSEIVDYDSEKHLYIGKTPDVSMEMIDEWMYDVEHHPLKSGELKKALIDFVNEKIGYE